MYELSLQTAIATTVTADYEKKYNANEETSSESETEWSDHEFASSDASEYETDH